MSEIDCHSSSRTSLCAPTTLDWIFSSASHRTAAALWRDRKILDFLLDSPRSLGIASTPLFFMSAPLLTTLPEGPRRGKVFAFAAHHGRQISEFGFSRVAGERDDRPHGQGYGSLWHSPRGLRPGFPRLIVPRYSRTTPIRCAWVTTARPPLSGPGASASGLALLRREEQVCCQLRRGSGRPG